jgi:glycosyltransferase involved in cell wall biosynthesis
MHFHDIPYSAVERQIWWVLGAFARRIIVVSAPCWPGRVGGKVQVVVNAVAPCRPALTDPPPLRTLRLGFIGRYHVHKGMDLLLNWTAAARQAGIDFSLVLRGRPDPDYLPYWARIQGRIRAEGLADCVVDQGWRSSTAVYDDLDIVVVPSQMPDPAPLVIPEAMGAGVVVVAYPSGGIPGLVPAGTGALVEHPAAFAKALHDFLTVPDLYRRTREAAYAHVRIAHDPDAVARHFAQVCVSALSPSPKVQA